MPIPYDRKRQLLLEKKQQLVPALQKHISLRNVPDALKLPTPAQRTLAQALEQGVQKQRLALQFLQREPAANTEQLLAAIHGEVESLVASIEGDSPLGGDKGISPDSKPSKMKDASPLADLLIEYGLYKNRMIAETVASSAYMSGVMGVVIALDRAREPQGAETETVTLALCAIAVHLIDQINEWLEEKYAHKMAVLQSGELGWNRFLPEGVFQHPVPDREDVLALTRMIHAGSCLGYANAEQVAEGEKLAVILRLVSLYRQIMRGEREEEKPVVAARIGFAMRVMEDACMFLSDSPVQKEQLRTLISGEIF